MPEKRIEIHWNTLSLTYVEPYVSDNDNSMSDGEINQSENSKTKRKYKKLDKINDYDCYKMLKELIILK